MQLASFIVRNGAIYVEIKKKIKIMLLILWRITDVVWCDQISLIHAVWREDPSRMFYLDFQIVFTCQHIYPTDLIVFLIRRSASNCCQYRKTLVCTVSHKIILRHSRQNHIQGIKWFCWKVVKSSASHCRQGYSTVGRVIWGLLKQQGVT